jgi:acyl-CoA thioester hydrolase
MGEIHHPILKQTGILKHAQGLRIGNWAASAYAWRMAEPFRHHHRVTYAECTVGDHIYHSRYLDLLEAARGEFMRSLGTPLLALQDADFIFPVIEARVRYKFPARYDDWLAIEVWLTELGKVRLNFGHRILNQDGKLILEAETFHACTSRAEKPKRLPPELVEKLKPYLNAAIQV